MENKKLVYRIAINVIPIIATILVAAAYSAYTTHQSTAGITIVQSSVKVYLDAQTTLLATTIDYGKITQGAQVIPLHLWLKNEGSGTVTAFWMSSLPPTLIVNSWLHDNVNSDWNNTQIDPGFGGVLGTIYSIVIPRTIPTGTYNWTITVGVAET